MLTAKRHGNCDNELQHWHCFTFKGSQAKKVVN